MRARGEITDDASGSGLESGSGMVAERGFIVGPDDRILVTGATGFIGSRVVQTLLNRGFRNLRCFTRSSSRSAALELLAKRHDARVEVVKGNLQRRMDCETAAKDVAVIFHLAAGTGEKSFSDAFLNSVVATRNLLDGALSHKGLRRFVLVSSLAVYANRQKPHWRLLDESCPVDQQPDKRAEAYCFAKVKQENLLREYAQTSALPYVIVRPGNVYGEGKHDIVGRVGIDTFGIFLHLGGSNTIPFTYVENCADAIVLAGLVEGVHDEIFNIVDDDLPSSRRFLREYKRSVRPFTSVYVPHFASHALCYLWEKYSQWSQGQLPPSFNRSRWHAYWKKTCYTNQKLKDRLGWKPLVPTTEGLRRYFQSCRRGQQHA